MFKKSQKPLLIMGSLTLIGFPLLAWPFLWYKDIEWLELLSFNFEDVGSLLALTSLGLFFGLLMILFTEMPYFEKSLAHIKDRLISFELNTFFVFFLSIAAGFGEEVFFRGALQPFLGIMFTSFFFVLIHGYFSTKNWKINFFGSLLFTFILFIGWIASQYSLWHAIFAHFSYDLVLLFYYKKMQRSAF